MHRAMDVIGLPIILLSSGEEVGAVNDILCDMEWHKLGVVIQHGGWLRSGAYIPSDRIHAVGEDYLTIEGKDAITSMQEFANQETIGFMTGKQKLKGKPVLTRNGDFLGSIEDVYFSLNWEKLVACELSQGWIADLTEGRKRLPITPSLVLGKKNLIVS
ncbi:PRC-barrel domain-containing protein [Brevibacillus sp. SYSU BS000544]|uniref:PRC-barrel domain-containing protein n=1 Tax=Brevibacillus sp. SYSU BS000544 TaxID=3416443 RepID=UPI003CE5623B